MADSTNKKILVNLSVVDNFIASEKRVKSYTKSVNALIGEHKKLKNQLAEVEAQLKANHTTEAQAEKRVDALNKKLGENAQKMKEREDGIASERKAQEGYSKTISDAKVKQDELASATLNLGKSLGELKNDLNLLKDISLDGLRPEEIAGINDKIVMLSGAIGIVEEGMKNFGDVQALKDMESGLNVASAAATIFSNALGVMGVESETLKEIQQTITMLISTTQALATISEFLNNVKVKSLLVTQQQAAANVTQAATTTGVTVATTAWGIAQKVLNAAMKALPIIAVIAGVAALVSGIKSLVSWLWGESDASKAAAESLENYQQVAQQTQAKVQQISSEESSVANALKEQHKAEIIALKQRGATAVEIAELELKQQQELADKTIEASQEREKQLNLELNAHKKAVDTQIALQAEVEKSDDKRYNAMLKFNEDKIKSFNTEAERQVYLGELRKKAYADTEEERKKLEELTVQQDTLNSKLRDEATIRLGASNAVLDKTQNVDAAKGGEQQENDDEAERQREKYRNIAKQAIQQKKELDIAKLKAEKDYQSEDFAVKQEYERKLLTLEQDAARETIELQRKHGEISKAERQHQLDMLSAKEQEFSNKQLVAQDTYAQSLLQQQQSVQKQLTKMLGDEFALQRMEVTEGYKGLIEDIEALMKKPIPLEEHKRLALEIVKIKEQLAAELEKIDSNEVDTKKQVDIQAQLNEKIKAVNELTDAELAAFADSEQEKLRIEIERLEKVKQAKEELGLDTGEEDAAIETAKLSKAQAETAMLLANENLTAKERYRIKREGLEKELNLLKVGSDEYKAKQEEMAELDQDFQDERFERAMEFAEKSKELMNGIFEFSNAQDEAKLEKATEQNEYDKQQLQAQLDANLISKDEYNKKVKESDDKLAKEKAKIARKQAIQEKANAVFDIGIKTAMAIMSALNTQPFLPMGPIMAGIAGAMGAIQLAAVLSAPLPKAAKGMYIKGAGHALGGVRIEAEGGEMIINKKSSSMFAPLLSAINEAGGGVPFVNTSTDGGFAMREYRRNDTQSVTSEAIADAVKNAVQEVKIYTAIEDINEGSKKYAAVTDSSSF